MESSSTSLTLTTDPAWPWSLPVIGPPALVVVALLLIGLTLWTYLGTKGASTRRIGLVLGLRLAALVLAYLALLRPSLAFRDELRVSSRLLIAADSSTSMTIQDEFNNQSRWNALLQTLRECESILQRLRSEHQIDVVLYRFDSDVAEFDPAGQAEGKRTDHAPMLDRLYKDHSHERYLRGLLILGDGADNGTRQQPLALAAPWRNLPCPIHTSGLGKPTTSDQQSDLALTAITPEPSPVPVKAELNIKANVDAPGFANAGVNFRLLFDDQEVTVDRVFINDRDATSDRLKQLPLSSGNQVRLRCTAPAKPGEIKVTLKVDPLPGEMTTANNEISTFLTVTKEGISVLLVDKGRFWEPRFIRGALAKDPRIRLHRAFFLRDEALEPDQADLFQFDKQHYDVIIIGDITAKRLASGAPDALTRIQELVDKKGTGLMMIGGYDTFGNGDWKGTPIAKLLPVELDASGQIEGRVRLEPTEQGQKHFLLKLADNPKDSAQLWNKLPELRGMTRLGTLKTPGATPFARSSGGDLMLAGHPYGSGRVLAFAGDTTWLWAHDPDGLVSHHRFWRQLVLWLARQEETEGNAWVKLDTRRLASGSQVGFSVGLRGKGGVDIEGAKYEVKVIGPDGVETPVLPARDKGEDRGSFWKTDTAGEYRVVVKASGKDAEGQESSGEASARFLVYQDTAEMTRRAADHDFLKKLAETGGGRFHRAEELKAFLEELRTQPLPQARPKTAHWPDWKSKNLSAFLVMYFLLFVALLRLEWFWRRRWGMV